jgi:hypothetical protein
MMNAPAIRSKIQFQELWEAGVLGNRLRTWRDPQAAYDSGVPLVGFRQLGAGGGGAFEMAQRPDILGTAARWAAEGRRYSVSEAAPDHMGTIQGEVCRGLGGWHGLLGPVVDGRRMRDSIRDGHLKPVSGVQVLDLLLRYMDPASRDDLDALLEIYPGHTVEFTCYTVELGFLPGRNTIFWEVRNY